MWTTSIFNFFVWRFLKSEKIYIFVRYFFWRRVENELKSKSNTIISSSNYLNFSRAIKNLKNILILWLINFTLSSVYGSIGWRLSHICLNIKYRYIQVWIFIVIWQQQRNLKLNYHFFYILADKTSIWSVWRNHSIERQENSTL